MPVTLAVCIPTHDGRAKTLAQTIDSVVAQLPEAPPGTAIVVSDNASQDGTEQLIDALKRNGVPLIYRRSETNLGPARNIDRAVRGADATWCWILSSDDLLAPGALRRIGELLRTEPPVAGVVVNHVVFDPGLGGPTAEQATACRPGDGVPRIVEGVDRIVGELGWVAGMISGQIVRRDEWVVSADRRERADAWAGLLWPQVAALLDAADANPRCLWCPEKLVIHRANTLPRIEISGNTEMPALLELDRHWREASAVGTRQARDQTLLWAASPGPLAAHRHGHWTPVERLRRVRGFARLFWRRVPFWRTVLPAVLGLPAPRLPRRAMPVLPTADRRVTIEVDVPPAMRQADELVLPCVLHNLGPRALSSAKPAPVHLSSRWRDEAGTVVRENLRTALRRPLQPCRSRRLALQILAPWETGTWTLEVAAVQEGVAWFEDGAVVADVAVER